jgi:hypothetical protein
MEHMKKHLLTFSILAMSVIPLFCQTIPTKKVLLSLQPGESLQTYESCINLSYTANQLYVVTRKGDKMYIYEGGQRKGPFDMDALKLKDCGETRESNCAVFNLHQQGEMSEFITYTDEGKMSINFKGKIYGPYKMISDLKFSGDKNWFIALVFNEGKFSVVSSGGVQLIEGSATYIRVSPIGKKYLVVCKDGEGVDPAILDMDMSKMSEQQMVEMAAKMAKKQESAGPPQAYLYTNNGEKFGPFPASEISENNPGFCITGGENWYMVLDNALYINGKLVKQYSSDEIYLDICKIWISADGKRYVIESYDKILFSDGSTYPTPVKVDIEKKEGKTYLKWLSLENEKDLVLYSKEL